MNDQEKREIIKAFAYGKTGVEVAEVTGMTLSETVEFYKENEAEILRKREELKEAGYLG